MNDIKRIEDLQAYLNSTPDADKLQIQDVIEANGWVNCCADDQYICIDRQHAQLLYIADDGRCKIADLDRERLLAEVKKYGNIRDILAQRIEELRRNKGLSKKQLAEAAELGDKHIIRIEQAKYSIRIDVLDKIAKALGVEIKLE